MFNPLARFELRYLSGSRKKGVAAFVKQTYERGKNPLASTPQSSFLLTHFDQLDTAIHYYHAIKNDPKSRLYKIDDANDCQEIKDMLANPESILVYTALLVSDANQRAKKVLDKKIRTYIEYKTNWPPYKPDVVIFNLAIDFGELYAVLTWNSKTIKIKLDELEDPRRYNVVKMELFENYFDGEPLTPAEQIDLLEQ